MAGRRWPPPLLSAPQRFPLVLLSHGTGGGGAVPGLARGASRRTRLHRRLPCITLGTCSGTVVRRVWWRCGVAHWISASFLLSCSQHPTFGERIDDSRIGAAGFSSGGYTVTSLAGGIYQPLLMGAYCLSPQAGPDCALDRRGRFFAD